MAQKIHPTGLRIHNSFGKNHNWQLENSNGPAFTKTIVRVQQLLKQFYQKQGYFFSDFYVDRDRYNIYITFRIKSSFQKNTFLHKTSKLPNSDPIKFPKLVTQAEEIVETKPLNFFVKTSTRNFLFSTEQHSLCKILFKTTKLYPFLIKSNLSQRLDISTHLTSTELASYIKEQIDLSSRRKQRIQLKPYLDKIAKKVMTLSSVQGIRLQIKGRLSTGMSNKAGRSQKELSSLGKIPLQTIHNQMDFSMTELRTKSGISSVKVWLNQKYPN